MSQTIQLQIPDSLFRSAQKIAEATQQSIESVVSDSLHKTLPPLDDIDTEESNYLVQMSQLDDDQLWKVSNQVLPVEVQEEFELLLGKQKSTELSSMENERLQELVELQGTIMVRKSHAWLLLARRGYKVPPQNSY